MNSLIKTNNLKELDLNRVTKRTILDCLMAIKIDHSIQISESDLEAKVNLLFADCKDISNSQFIERSNEIRKSNLFGKLPKNIEFTENQLPILVFKLNEIAGDQYFESIETQPELSIKCFNHMKSKAYQLPLDVRTEIKAQFKQPVTIK